MLNWLEKNQGISLTITLLIASIMFYISSLSFSSTISYGIPSLNSILYHITSFFFLSFFLSISLIRGKYKKLFPITIVIAIIYGFSDELHQFFVPGRSCTYIDVSFDTIGIVFASLIYLIIIEYRKNKKVLACT